MSRCEATTRPILWWRTDIDFPQCRRSASVEIDEIQLCLQHAGLIAIQKLLNSGQAIKLDSADPHGPLCNLGYDRYAKRIGK